MPKMQEKPFWQTKKLEEMSAEEWESLCDGCGRCCLHKIEDEDSGEIYATSVACVLLDGASCRCRNYPERQNYVADCIRLKNAEQVRRLPWLPLTCAYRLIAAGKKLKWWHYLVSGSFDTVHEAGISARGKIKAYENALGAPEDYLPYITHKIC